MDDGQFGPNRRYRKATPLCSITFDPVSHLRFRLYRGLDRAPAYSRGVFQYESPRARTLAFRGVTAGPVYSSGRWEC